MNKVLLDTNVLIYSIDEDSKYYSQTKKLIFESSSELFTSSKNISEFLSVITRLPGNILSIKNALAVVQDFTDIFTILYPSEASFSIFKKLLQKYQPTGLKIHDFEIISIGLANGISAIATVNIKDFKNISEVELFSW